MISSRLTLLSALAAVLGVYLAVSSGGHIPFLGMYAYPDLYEATIEELQEGLKKRRFTSVDLVKAYLARIDEVNIKGPGLRAIIETNPHPTEGQHRHFAQRRHEHNRGLIRPPRLCRP